MEHFPNNQEVSDREIRISPSAVFNCKISPEGLIDYANHQFSEISGYEEYELIGESMDMLRHPEMPEIFFHVLLDRLQKKEPMRLFAKFLAKDKRYFWLMIDFETKVDDEGNIIAHYSNSRAASKYAVHKVDSLHKILTKIEQKTGNTESSKRYLIGFLEERSMNYNQYIEDLSTDHPEYEQPYKQEQTITETLAPPVQKKQTTTTTNRLEFTDSDFIKRKPNAPSNTKLKEKTLLKKIFGK